MTELSSLIHFFSSGVQELGGLVETVGHEDYEFILPNSLKAKTDNGYLRLNMGSHPLTVNSPLIETLCEVLSEKVCVARAFLNPQRIQGGDLQEKWTRRFHLAHGRPTLVHSVVEETAHALIHVKAAFVSESKEEHLYQVALNLTTGTAQPHVATSADSLFLDPVPRYGDIPKFCPLPFDVWAPALETAFASVSEADVEKFKQRQERFVARDLTRIEDYFSQMATELIRQQSRLDSAASPHVKAALQSRRAALDLEYRKKREDIREKHRLVVEPRVYAVLLVFQPWIKCLFQLSSRDNSREATFFWDPVLKDFQPILCGSCRTPTTAITLQTQTLLCPACTKKL